jgi:hypothetical protein
MARSLAADPAYCLRSGPVCEHTEPVVKGWSKTARGDRLPVMRGCYRWRPCRMRASYRRAAKRL